nr:2-dehydro-3-deoxy-6-phosphogalactonate aldolase [Marinicella sp. W31]MDC2879152.1 2-dehydro-3-deoxy-6-phosphogalactonate aldolase [Marinicella sp. W31]
MVKGLDILDDAFAAMPLVAILRGVTVEEVDAVADAVIAAGFRFIEVPLNSPDPFTSIVRLSARLPEDVLVGAGTVLDVADVDRLHEAGGTLMVSPNVDPAVIGKAVSYGMATMPGALTPTECFRALKAGASAVKIFPAGRMGPDYLPDIKAVLPKGTRLLPVGGVDVTNMAAFMEKGRPASVSARRSTSPESPSRISLLQPRRWWPSIAGLRAPRVKVRRIKASASAMPRQAAKRSPSISSLETGSEMSPGPDGEALPNEEIRMSIDVLSVAPLPPRLDRQMEEAYAYHRYDEVVARGDLEALIPRIRALAANGESNVTADFIAQFPNLEILSVFGVGYDGVDVAAAHKHGVIVTHTPGVLTDDVSDHAIGLMLSVARRTPVADRFVRKGKWVDGGFPFTKKSAVPDSVLSASDGLAQPSPDALKRFPWISPILIAPRWTACPIAFRRHRKSWRPTSIFSLRPPMAARRPVVSSAQRFFRPSAPKAI